MKIVEFIDYYDEDNPLYLNSINIVQIKDANIGIRFYLTDGTTETTSESLVDVLNKLK